MNRFRLVEHAPGAPGMRWLGLGPGLRPTRALWKLQRLLDQHTFWASGRTLRNLRQTLDGSAAVVSIWKGQRMVAFGRASSDGIFRAVLWDVVVATDLQGQGLGRQVVEALLNTQQVRSTERVYLMTTNGSGFYQQLGFRRADSQQLLVLRRNTH